MNNNWLKDQSRKVEIKVSADGSHTLFVPELDEHYHSVNGAYNESMHVFIEPALQFCQKASVSILEIGLGTGLNAFLSAINQGDKTIFYHALEKYPITPEAASHLNFAKAEAEQQLFTRLHELPWNEAAELQPGFTLLKDEADLTNITFDRPYDLVYFDAFAPEVQPEMWGEAIFQKIYKAMNNDGILTTYCAKGVVRRTMQAVGFTVERLPGPKGKREMLRAVKK
ncbi:tRNA (5-methylaminomethyl-2-thiouridine)(34)-methyltransferase MnmD [Carboxylicivirga mesophila]|uniref:tRNA (5-methylaminomethyl-2-thiouridine)(34)-methyltransferase MnmD n=1 Tax=Carboxylicivirga mesophila TaxID=1166478 RepID=A0ABS5KFH1_9BACT|nr:tRNA (5-methylaminomethyl-2-thiouridine)(34)-methyltransferase MnmD [Carboxylicivirga mesophila]MBS2213824.1 tRNA (5-methylaminomethyl-2-thiouridine)(34)-methyltransferase MnmD [Carboxylicivirga mesophila]